VVSTYTIGETSKRSGFSASALRFYEDIGLVDPVGRTAAGYRLYDDDSLDRLSFIARPRSSAAHARRSTSWSSPRSAPPTSKPPN
jgi:hypothetical protein